MNKLFSDMIFQQILGRCDKEIIFPNKNGFLPKMNLSAKMSFSDKKDFYNKKDFPDRVCMCLFQWF